MKNKKDTKKDESKSTKPVEEGKKKTSVVGRLFKILGIGLASIIGLFGVAVAIAAISGVFNTDPIQIETLSWETEFTTEKDNPSTIRVVNDFKAKINYTPANANVLDLDLKLVVPNATGILKFPAKVKAGEEFTVEVVKNANGVNIGGEVILQAKTQLVSTEQNLQVLVDVPIPTNGLKLVSNFDGKELTSGSQDIKFYAFTDPKNAIYPSVNLSTAYKNITLTSAIPSNLEVKNNGTGVQGSGFYCPDYIAHDHDPFLTTRTHIYNGQTIDLGAPVNYLMFEAIAYSSTDRPVTLTAKALRTYEMQEDYISLTDAKYQVEGGRAQFFSDLSAYVDKYKTYIISDTRSFTYQNTTFNSGAAFIESVTQTDATTGENKVVINDINQEYEAAIYYLFVEVSKDYNIETIEVASMSSSLASGEPVKFALHGTPVQLNDTELMNMFGLTLNPTNTIDFSSADLVYRMRELKLMCIMNNGPSSTDEYEQFDLNNYVFEIENPSNLEQPIWKLTCINPVSAEDKVRNVRLRVYLPKNINGAYTDDCIYHDFSVDITEVAIASFDFKTNHGINTTMVVNNQQIGTAVHKQELTANAYNLVGQNNQVPTYNMVKWFVDTESAKTLSSDGMARSDYFKIKLSNTGSARAYQMPTESGDTISAYEIAYTEGGKTILEAINASNVYSDNDPLRIFAAVVKTNHEGFAVDNNGEAQYVYDTSTHDYVLNQNFTNYVIIARTSNLSSATYLELTTEYYLENVNFYTQNNSLDVPTYDLRNVPTTGGELIPQVKLLADEAYTLYATGYILAPDGAVNTAAYPSDDGVDYLSNIRYAMNRAEAERLVKINVSSVRQYIELPLADSFRVNGTTGLWEIDINALIDKTATNSNTGTLDLYAKGVGLLDGVLSQQRSTVNMKVNYATITEFDIKTNFTETYTKNNPGVDPGDPEAEPVEPQEESFVYANTFILRPQITSLTGIEWRASTAASDGTMVNSEREFGIDLDYSNDLINTDGSYGDKIDSSYANSKYVNGYINRVFNPNNGSTIGVNWHVTFADGSLTKMGESISDYITVRTVIESTTQDLDNDGNPDDNDNDGNPDVYYFFKPIIDIKKGSQTGVEVKLTCTLGLYQTNAGYIQQLNSSLDLTLIQSSVVYEFYTEKKDAGGNDILVVNNVGEKSALVLTGGESVDLLQNLTPTSESGLPVYRLVGDNYIQEVDGLGNQLYRKYRVIANLDTDNKLAKYCTYTVANSDIARAPIYFLDENGNKVSSAMPTSDGKLFLYADYITTDTDAVLSISSPFGGRAQTYNIIVKSSVNLIKPASNLVTSTTKANNGQIDLATQYKAQREISGVWQDQIVSFEVDANSSTYANTQPAAAATAIRVKAADGTITEKTPKTIFTPANVYEAKTINLKMYYYLSNGDGTYTEYEVNAIDGIQISIQVIAGYVISLNVDGNVEETSGSIVDLFNKYGQNPSTFITITNATTGQDVSVEDLTDQTIDANGNKSGLLYQLISLEYYEDVIDEIELFNSLFTSEEQKNNIKKGTLNTESISSAITIAVRVKFIAGFADGVTALESLGDSAWFTIKLNASLLYAINGNNAEGSSYDTTKDENATIGHTYSGVNTTITSEQYVLQDQNQPLYTKGSPANIISLTGGNGGDLFASKFVSVRTYIYNDSRQDYVLYDTTSKYAKFKILTQVNGEELTSLTLSIVGAVNQVERFKLEIVTEYGDYAEVTDKNGKYFDYYFSLAPLLKTLISYPIEDEGSEKVAVSSQVNLLESFINENNRLRLYTGSNTFMTIVEPTGGETRYAIKNGATLVAYLPEGVKPFTYEVIEGPAVVDGDLITFVAPTTTAIATVRCVAFNGAYVDYKFNVYTGANPVVITPNNTTIYADNINAYNLFDYLTISNQPSDIKYVVKYQTIATPLFTTSRGNGQVTSTNQTLTYLQGTPNTLNMWFNDVTVNGDITQAPPVEVVFNIWHNYNVNGDSPIELRLTLRPNLIVEKDNEYQTMAAGTDVVIMSNDASVDSYIKLGNTGNTSSTISLEVSQVKEAGATNFVAVTADHLAKYKFSVVPSFSGSYTNYTLSTFNIENKINIKIKVLKSTYYYEFEVVLMPNINFNVDYLADGNTDISNYVIKGAAASNNSKSVGLQEFIKPTDFEGNPITVSSNLYFEMVTYAYDENGAIISDVTHVIPGTHIENTKFDITVKAVNMEYVIYADIKIVWKNNIPAGATSVVHTQQVRFRIIPNIEDSVITYSEGTTAISLYAGSEVSLNFNSATNQLVLSQGANETLRTAAINARQQKVDASYEYVNVVLKAVSGENYSLTGSGSTGTLTIGKYINSNQIVFEVYYDLIGVYEGVIVADPGSGEPFNDPSKLYKSNYSLRVVVVPSLETIVYTNEDTSNDSSANPYDLSAKFEDLQYEEDEADLYASNAIKANEIELVGNNGLLTVGTNNAVSFDDITKILVNEVTLLGNIDYTVTGKYGSDATSLTSDLSESEANRSIRLDVRTVGGDVKLVAIVSIPTLVVADNNYFEYKLTLTVPGVVNDENKVDIYIKFVLETGKNGTIIMPDPTSDSNTRLANINLYNANGVTEYALSGNSSVNANLFTFGYLLGTSAESAIPNHLKIAVAGAKSQYHSTYNIKTLVRNSTAYYAYALPNVELFIDIDGAIDYATIVERGGVKYLQVDPYFTTAELPEENKRRINLIVSTGVITETFTLVIEPIMVTQNLSVDSTTHVVTNSLNYTLDDEHGVEQTGTVDLAGMENIVELLYNGDNAANVKKWLKLEGSTYKFEPNTYDISEETIIVIQGKIVINGQSINKQEFITNTGDTISVTPTVLFKQGLTETTPKSDATGDPINIIGNADTALIKSNIFEAGATWTNTSVTLELAPASANILDYATLNITAVDGVYTIAADSTITLKQQNLIEDVVISFIATTTFVNNAGTTITFVKNLELIISKNAGISGLSSNYNLVSTGANSGKVTLDGSGAKITGTGEFAYKVKEVACTGSINGEITNAQIVITPTINDTGTAKYITEFTLDWSAFIAAHSVTDVDGITIQANYVFGGEIIPIKVITFSINY